MYEQITFIHFKFSRDVVFYNLVLILYIKILFMWYFSMKYFVEEPTFLIIMLFLLIKYKNKWINGFLTSGLSFVNP